MAITTGIAICAASFLLGSLFTSELWDSAVLFGTKGPVTPEIIGFVEEYYLTWWEGAMAVKMTLHVVLLILFITLTVKVATYTETSFYFSGGSLLLLILTTSLYLTITLPSMRILASFPLNASRVGDRGRDLFTRLQEYISKGNSGPAGDEARANAAAHAALAGLGYDERVETVSVLCAANTIAMTLLVGIIVLQIGEWWVQETVIAPVEREERKQALAAAAVAPVTEEKKDQ